MLYTFLHNVIGCIENEHAMLLQKLILCINNINVFSYYIITYVENLNVVNVFKRKK